MGTFHVSGKMAPTYIRELYHLITKVEPDLICAELSPEQLNGKMSTTSKPEYQEAILPAANDNGIGVVPIQPNTEEGVILEKKKDAVIKSIKSDEKRSLLWSLWESYEEYVVDNWLRILNSKDGIIAVQSELLDKLYFEPWFHVIEKHFPEFIELWTSWNRHFLSVIENVIDRKSHKRLLVTVGLWHKFWLRNELEKRGEVKILEVGTLKNP